VKVITAKVHNAKINLGPVIFVITTHPSTETTVIMPNLAAST